MTEPDRIEPCEFTVDELLARPYHAGDAPALAQAVRESIASLSRWLDWCHAGYGLDDARQWIDFCERGWISGEQYAFAVFDEAGSRFLGAVGITQRNRRQNFGGIGYWIRKSVRGRAIASRVARHVAAFGFERVGLDRIEILAAVDNAASRCTAERTGALFEGVQRNRLRLRDQAIDAATYALIPSDLANQTLAQTRATSS